jgi:lysophospholipid acyltransferase (LPLAT)-like uncharacterized protein
MLQQSATWFGYSIWVYRRQSQIRAKDQLVDFLRNGPCVIGLFADSGGPYGMVKPGLPEVARESDSMLVPFAVSSNPVVMMRKPRKYGFPLPFSSMEVFWGRPFEGNKVTVKDCQKALIMQMERSSEG